MTARAFDSMFLFIDFVRVANCFYDYDYDYDDQGRHVTIERERERERERYRVDHTFLLFSLLCTH